MNDMLLEQPAAAMEVYNPSDRFEVIDPRSLTRDHPTLAGLAEDGKLDRKTIENILTDGRTTPGNLERARWRVRELVRNRVLAPPPGGPEVAPQTAAEIIDAALARRPDDHAGALLDVALGVDTTAAAAFEFARLSERQTAPAIIAAGHALDGFGLAILRRLPAPGAAGDLLASIAEGRLDDFAGNPDAAAEGLRIHAAGVERDSARLRELAISILVVSQIATAEVIAALLLALTEDPVQSIKRAAMLGLADLISRAVAPSAPAGKRR